MDDLRSKGIKAFIWDFSGSMGTQGVGFVFSIFLARLLEPAEFGLIAMVMVVIGIASVFTDIGLGGALIQRRKVLPVHYSSVFYFNILVGLFLTIVTYLSAQLIGDFYDNDALVPLAQVMSLSFTINAFSSVQAAKLRKELDYAVLTKSSFIASLVSGVLGVSLAFSGAGVWSLVIQTLSMGVIYNISIWVSSNWVPSLQFSYKSLRQLWGFGFRFFLANVINSVFTHIDYLIIGKLFLPTTLGFYQRAKSLSSMAVQLPSSSLMTILFPVLSQIKNDLPRFQSVAINTMNVISFVIFLVIGALYLVSEELIVFIFGAKWIQSIGYFQILIFSGFGYPLGAFLVNVLAGRGNSKAILRLEIYKKLLFSFSFVALYFGGIEAYLYGLIVTTVLNVLLNIHFASREIRLPFHSLFKPVLVQATVLLAAILVSTYITSEAGIESGSIFAFVIGFLFFAAYILISWLFKTESYSSVRMQVSSLVKQWF